MNKNVVRQESFDFALRIIETFKFLSREKREFVLSKQMLRSGTSIGANIEEADASISMAEFSAKISVAYKEARETGYWLKLLFHSNYLDKQTFDSLFLSVDELCKLLYSILRSAGRIKDSKSM